MASNNFKRIGTALAAIGIAGSLYFGAKGILSPIKIEYETFNSRNSQYVRVGNDVYGLKEITADENTTYCENRTGNGTLLKVIEEINGVDSGEIQRGYKLFVPYSISSEEKKEAIKNKENSHLETIVEKIF